MPGRTLPLISSTELQRHRTAASCYVSYGGRVFDLTSFLDDHPGGGDLILEYGGRDVQEIMGDEVSHMHSESAYEILEDSVVGLLDEIPCSKISTQKMSLSAHDGQQASPKVQDDRPPSGASLAEASPESSASLEAELSLETNAVDDFRRHRFLDLNRPLLMQVWNGGFSKDFYLAEVHRPRHYKGGKSAPLFGNFLEPLSKTPWWAVPSIWLPSVIYGTVLSREGMNGWGHVATFWLSGLAIWTLVEYGLHRCLFHVDRYLPDNQAAITAHFLLHGIHHYLPMDKLRLVMPPVLFVILATPFWKLVHIVVYWNCLPAYYREIKKYHLQHHYSDHENGFGVTSRFWDRVFGTELSPPKAAKAA
ncbi:MAG: fatty acid alpha-hydroxylase [Lichina confinis]|nr:MAG: fatty acid alpha-hydroxylase [Lichina confinis]